MSASLNRAMIIGNITRDIELKSTQSGQSVCSFGVATNRSWKNKDGQKQEDVQFHNVVAWGKLAEIIAQYMSKGKKIYIDGRLQTREYETKDGQTRRSTEIVAENMIMLGSKGEGGNTTRHDDMGGIEVCKIETTNSPAPRNSDQISLSDIPF